MSLHFEAVRELGIRASVPFKKKEDNHGDSQFVVNSLIHCADLSAQAHPFHIAEKWSDLILQEFKHQSEEEIRLGLPQTPHMMDLEKPRERLILQMGFVNGIVLPLFSALVKNVGSMQCYVDNCNIVIEELKKRKGNLDTTMNESPKKKAKKNLR